jgi:hypothetical protein
MRSIFPLSEWNPQISSSFTKTSATIWSLEFHAGGPPAVLGLADGGFSTSRARFCPRSRLRLVSRKTVRPSRAAISFNTPSLTARSSHASENL